MRNVSVMIAVVMVTGCTGIGDGDGSDDNEAEDTQELGTAATVFGVSTSTAQGYSISIRQDRVAGTDPNTITFQNYFTLGNRNPSGPDESLRYRVSAADDAMATAGGLLVGVGLTAGMSPDAITAALASVNIVIQIGTVFGTVAPGPPGLGHLVRLLDTAIDAAGIPGGGCILFHVGVTALGLPDGCDDASPAPQLAGGGPHVLIDVVGPTTTARFTQTDLAAPGGGIRESNTWIVGVREAAITPLTERTVVAGLDPVATRAGGILIGLGLATDAGPVTVAGLLASGGIPIAIETLTTINPGPPNTSPTDLANLAAAAMAAVGPADSSIIIQGGIVALGMAASCTPGQP